MTIKEQCLEKIQSYIDDCDEYKDTEHRYAALVLAIVKRDIELNIEEPAAADVAPVVHGEWVPIVNHFHGKPDGRYYCSVCHRVETTKGIYCRLCGARMDGGNSNA